MYQTPKLLLVAFILCFLFPKIVFASPGCIYPQAVISGAVPSDMGFKEAITVALVAWSCCHAGGKRPKKFGDFMISFYKRFGISPTIENLHREADKLL